MALSAIVEEIMEGPHTTAMYAIAELTAMSAELQFGISHSKYYHIQYIYRVLTILKRAEDHDFENVVCFRRYTVKEILEHIHVSAKNIRCISTKAEN